MRADGRDMYLPAVERRSQDMRAFDALRRFGPKFA
jgi:hypothetical protein